MPSPLSLSARALAALLLVAPSRLPAQTNLERVVNGSFTPSHGYDLIHQRIGVSGFDWDSTAFDGEVRTTVVSLRPELDAVVLDMDRQLEVRAVTEGSARGKALRFDRPGDSLVVRLARPAQLQDTVRFTVAYRGRIRHGWGLYFFKEERGPPHRPQQVYSGGGTDGNPRWIPTYGPPHDKATWELIATVPARFRVVSNGRLVSDRLREGRRTTHWAQERPASTYLISLVVAPLVRVRDRWRDVPLDYYVYDRDSALARPLFGVTADMMETFTRLTGVRYPWTKYAQTTVAEFIGGMENVGATTLVDWLPDRRAYLDRPWYQHVLIPHELAHQWFGNFVTAENWANYWLNEGFAQFMVGQYWAAKLGTKAEDDFYVEEYQQFLVRDTRRRTPLATYNSSNVYSKGALVLRMLKQQLGERPFWAAVNRYLARHGGATATTDDLRQAVLETTGQSLDWFWSQWMYQAGYPEFVVTAEWDSIASAVTLTVRQVQQDTLRADTAGVRFTVPHAFRAPLAIRVGTAAGDVVHRTIVDRREQAIRVEGVRGPPTMIVFDDENAVLKSLRFDQPTAWLATMLARHPDLWNRGWAIGQLATRTGDPLAGAALGAAARRADYPLTRVQAATALAGFPAAIARPALEAALRDSSARVREAAVASLASVGGPGAAELAAASWSRDPSYNVRASALTALARLDPAGARDAIAAGLATPSYRDAIQNAARAALGRLLEDERPWVREWAREAAAREGGGTD